MARHLMAVCVVCLLCAEHLPCHQHLDAAAALGAAAAASPSVATYGPPDGLSIAAQRYVNTLHLPNEHHQSAAVSAADYEYEVGWSETAKARRSRSKRHAHHEAAEDKETPDIPAKSFVKKLFERFGTIDAHSNTQTMNVLGFERMLDQLGLAELLQAGGKTHPAHAGGGGGHDDGAEDETATQCISSMDLVIRVSSVQPPANHGQDHEHDDHDDHDNHNTQHSSIPANQNATGVNYTVATTSAKIPGYSNSSGGGNSRNESAALALAQAKEELSLNEQDLAAICPILLYQLTEPAAAAVNSSVSNVATTGSRGCIDENLIAKDFATRHSHDHSHVVAAPSGASNRTLVWVYAMMSILIASLCGLLAVAVIPCMESAYYHYLLQFFVALGVGTLAGDALLHLFPHAMMTRPASADMHVDMTLKGLVAAVAVAFSFLMERGLTMVAEWRKRVEKKGKPSSRVRVMRDPDSVSMSQHNHNHNHNNHHGHSHNHHHADHHNHHGHSHGGKSQPIAQQQQHQLLLLNQMGGGNGGGNGGGGNGRDGTGEKLCKAKYSSYPYCYDEIDMETRDDHHHHNNRELDGSTAAAATALSAPAATGVGHKGSPSLSNSDNHTQSLRHGKNTNHKVQYKHEPHEHDTAQSLLPAAPASLATGAAAEDCGAAYVPTTCKLLENGGGGDGADVEAAAAARKAADALPEENYTIILREHEAKHHGHSHTHGHVHSPPNSMSAVAWMVIMGDGLHNFTDGMAIGAAFSYNIAGGFSTALAVFCHELPHELGDFAILLKAGMSARQAIYYNVLSSVLSFIGTVIGIWIGETPEASAWVFAAAAGMFLYIAMVDMMPELASSHKEGTFAYTEMLLQMVGILLGIGIMLLIAMYENNLQQIFASAGLDGSDGLQH